MKELDWEMARKLVENSKGGAVVVPYGFTEVGDSAFSEREIEILKGWSKKKRITEIILPEGITRIGNFSFANCKMLKKIVIPKSVQEIGSYAFLGCSKLERVVIPDGTKIINEGAFFDCGKLKEIKFSKNLTKIPRMLCWKCSLKKVYIPENVTVIEEGAFGMNTELISVNIPEKIEEIAYNVFFGSKIPEFSVPTEETLQKICRAAFGIKNIK